MVLPFASPSPFSLGFPEPEGHLYLPPRASARRECWSNPSAAGGHQGQLWDGLPEVWTIRCALRTRYVQLLSGFVGTSGGFVGFVLPSSKCLVTGIPRLIGSSREKEYPSLSVRACDGLSCDTSAGSELSKAVLVVMWQMGIC